MLELDNLKVELEGYRTPLKDLYRSLDLENKENRIVELNRRMEEPDFWNDPEKSAKQSKELGSLKEDVSIYKKLDSQFNDMFDLIDMANEDNDEALASEIKEEFESFKSDYEKIRLKTLLSGEYDSCNAILRLNAGAGGTESCDWCSMLFRMYSKWAESHDFKTEVLDSLDGDEAGLKSCTFQINGENAYGYLKSEKGVHRLVRISPFNAQGKRQTSFVSLDVMPDIEDDIDVEIKPDDIRIDTYRSSGAGGQHINKTSSAIRITHFPTGIVVTCQNERSQFQNKDKAMQMLKSKLLMLAMEENQGKLDEIRGEVKDNAWGSQIRSYFLQPYQLVKDLRTGVEIAQADSVLNGNLDPFINGYLVWMANGGKMVQHGDDE
ncbi:MAG: peptide chain release factor 2 [Lachnospiraceae bacterium]|nr:peptide chain release factor 2 [Lachnospiraceae bacterium]